MNILFSSRLRALLCAFGLGAVLCLGLSGCGRRGTPSPPGPAADITYPQTYPAP